MIKHKKIFECFSCFWKVFCFFFFCFFVFFFGCKNVKILKKRVLPCFGDSVAGWSSRMPQSWAHTEIFRDSLAGQCPFCVLSFLVSLFCVFALCFICFFVCLSVGFVFFCCCMYTFGVRASLLKMQAKKVKCNCKKTQAQKVQCSID